MQDFPAPPKKKAPPLKDKNLVPLLSSSTCKQWYKKTVSIYNTFELLKYDPLYFALFSLESRKVVTETKMH